MGNRSTEHDSQVKRDIAVAVENFKDVLQFEKELAKQVPVDNGREKYLTGKIL